MKHLVLISSSSSSEADRRLALLAEMAGVPTCRFDLTSQDALDQLTHQLRDCNENPIAASAATLTALHKRIPALACSFVEQRCAFVYGCADPGNEDLLSRLSDNTLVRVEPSRGQMRYSLIDMPEFAGAIAEVSFSAEGEHRRFRKLCSERSIDQIISAGGEPFFVHQRQRGRRLFMAASANLLDLDGPSDATALQIDAVLGALPALIFLRSVFGPACWHNPFPQATIVIDDPLLRPRYGFLSYERLARELAAARGAATFAFIPWNYRRSSRAVIESLRRDQQHLSICVHGCDHTGGEFDSDDYDLLRYKAALAIERMEEHRHRNGLAYEPVMVFPQGRYSRAALRALKAEGYLAVVNTTPFPSDPAPLPKVRDLFETAITCYERFPVFGRRYPIALEPVALDLFLNKPVILVEHHTYFRNGYSSLTEFQKHVNRLDPRLIWAPLMNVLLGSVLYRKSGETLLQAKTPMSKFVVANPCAHKATIRVRAESESTDTVNSVLCDGHPIDAHASSGEIEAELDLQPGERVLLELPHSKAASATSSPRLPAGYAAQVAARRYLSEIRDNYLSNDDSLGAIVRRVRDIRHHGIAAKKP